MTVASSAILQRDLKRSWLYVSGRTRTSLSGYTWGIRGDKNAGRWSVWGISVNTRSPGFEINDLGQLRRGDDIVFSGDYQFRDTKPHKKMRYWQVGHSFRTFWNYGGVRAPDVGSSEAGQEAADVEHRAGVYLRLLGRERVAELDDEGDAVGHRLA